MKRTAAALVALFMALFGTVMVAGGASAAPAYPPQPPALSVGACAAGGVSASLTNMKPATTVAWTFQKSGSAAGSASSTANVDGVAAATLAITESGTYTITATGTNSANAPATTSVTVALSCAVPPTPGVIVTTATTDGVTVVVGPGLKPGTPVSVTMVGCGSTVTGTGTVGTDGNATVSMTGAVECTYTATITGTKADGSAYSSTAQVVVLGLEDDCADSGASGSDCDSSATGGSDSSSDDSDSSASSDDSASSGSSSDTIAATGAGDSVTLLGVGVVALLIGGTAVLVARSRRWGKDAV